jgi:hypothetical protein
MKLLGVLALVASLLLATAAHAEVEPSRRAVVFAVREEPLLSARLTAELRSQGFEPIEVDPEEGVTAADPFGALAAALSSHQAGFAIRVVVGPAAIHLWIANAATGKRLHREAPLATDARPDSALVSLWAVEALRATAVAPLPTPAPTVTAPAAPPPPPAPAYALQVAPTITVSPGGLGVAPQVWVGARRSLTRRTGAELFVVLPTLPSRIEHATGSADVSRAIVALGPQLSTGEAESRWSAQVGAGASMTVVRVSGVGAGGFEGRTDHLVSGGPYARAGIALRVTRWFRARADAAAGLAFPRPVVLFDEQRVATWGQPWLTAGLGGEVVF